MNQPPEDQPPEASEGRASRFWLYAPFALLALIVVGWTAAWFVVRSEVERRIDSAIAVQAAQGRQWDCVNRTIRGFPFRIEISCASLSLAHDGGEAANFGPVQALAQVYQPRHVIAFVGGPLRATRGPLEVEAQWRHLEASLRGLGSGGERLSLVAREPRVRVEGLADVGLTASGDLLELHARPSPGGSAGALDLVLRAANAQVPALDPLFGDPAPAQIELQARLHEARALAGGTPAQILEQWRGTGGRLELALLDIVRGDTRLRGSGEFLLDEERRLAGRVEASAAGAQRVLSNAMGSERAGMAGAMLGALAGPRRQTEGPGADLTPLPPMRLEGGRVFVGPFALPGIRLGPLY